MKLLFLFISLLLISNLSFATTNLASSVVKVTTLDNKTNFKFNGSGLAFKYRGLFFVVTSEHVILPNSSTDQLILIRNNDGQVLEADLLKSDWASGLSLLQLPNEFENSQPLPDLSELSLNPPSLNTLVYSLGYPARSNGLIVDNNGTLTEPFKIESILLDSPLLHEVQGASTEFGMSGGVLLNQDLQFLGILSHKKKQDLTYAIPSVTVISWIEEAIDQANFNSYIQRLRTDRGTGLTLTSGKFILNEVPRNKEIRIRYLLLSEEQQTKNYPHPLFSTGEKLCKKWVKKSQDNYPIINLLGFRKLGLLNISNSLVQVSNLLDFFTELKVKNRYPIAYVSTYTKEIILPWGEYRATVNSLEEINGIFKNRKMLQDLNEFKLQWEVLLNILQKNMHGVDESHPLMELTPKDLNLFINDEALSQSWSKLKKRTPQLTNNLLSEIKNLEIILATFIL